MIVELCDLEGFSRDLATLVRFFLIHSHAIVDDCHILCDIDTLWATLCPVGGTLQLRMLVFCSFVMAPQERPQKWCSRFCSLGVVPS